MIGTIADVVKELTESEMTFIKKEIFLKNYLKDTHISDKLKSSLLNYLKFYYHGHEEQE